jgi:hypothetical protein
VVIKLLERSGGVAQVHPADNLVRLCDVRFTSKNGHFGARFRFRYNMFSAAA